MNTLLSLLLLLGVSFYAHAHKPSDSYLNINIADQRILGQWDIALRDLDYALSLDGNNNGQITWAELRGNRDAVFGYALNRLQIAGDSQKCALTPTDLLVDEHSDGHYAVLRFAAECPIAAANYEIDYGLFFDLDPQHRGLLTINRGNGSDAAVLGPERRHTEFALARERGVWLLLADFAQEGVWHIWIGFDHILFLLSLLLPAALTRESGGWQRKSGFYPVLWDVLAVVTAFTVAHSLTLTLTVLNVIALPSRWVESAIAASVAIAAFNNIVPVFGRYRAGVAFGFGLIHGMGIASVLLDMGLPDQQRLLPLLGFNVGVEAGQLAIVAVALPLIVCLSRYRYYPALAMKLGSVAIIAVALVWLVERSLDLQLRIL